MSNMAFIDQTRARVENMKMRMEDKESREINLKVFRPADKLKKEEKKKEEILYLRKKKKLH